MKCYIYHIPLLIAAMLVAGCDNIFSGNEEEEEGTVTLTLSTSGALSKAGMDQGLGIVWENNDEVLINGERYRVSPGEQDLTSVSVSGVYESDGYLAIYPYSRQYTAGDSYLVDIPAEQAYGTDMPVESYPMIGYSTSTDLQMSGVCGIVRIGVNGTGQIGSVTVTGGSADDILSGTLTIPAADVTGGSLKGSYSDFYTEYSTSGSVTVSIDKGLQAGNETRYIYAAIPARTYSSGLKITFEYTSGNTTEIETESGVTVGRAAVTDLGTFTLEGGEEEPEYGNIYIMHGPGPNYLNYEITADPDSRLSVSLVTVELWDRTAESGTYQSGDDICKALLLQYGSEAVTDADGKYNGSFSEAYGIDGTCALEPSTEYKMLVGYTDGSAINGTPEYQSLFTSAAAYEEVQLHTEILPGEKDYKDFYTGIMTTGATEIKYVVAEKEWYDECAGQGLTDRDIIENEGTVLSPEELEAANSSEGLVQTWTGTPSMEIVFMVLAKGESGDEKIEFKSYTTSAYLPQDAQWKTISTDGYMECGLLSALFDGGAVFPIGGLTVEQLGGYDIFRIPNPFTSIIEAFKDQGYFTGTDGSLILDARNGYVLLELFANYAGILCPTVAPDDTEGLSFVSRPEFDGQGSYGTYYAGSGSIDFGDILMYINGEYYNTEPTVLWFHNPNPETETPGFSTEDFEIVNDEW